LTLILADQLDGVLGISDSDRIRRQSKDRHSHEKCIVSTPGHYYTTKTTRTTPQHATGNVSIQISQLPKAENNHSLYSMYYM
jgi:hypothetical protein